MNDLKNVRMKMLCWAGILIAMVFAACKKRDDLNERLNVPAEPVAPAWTPFPRLPKIPLPFSRCIFSYQDLTDALGSNSVAVASVVLANGVVLHPAHDLKGISYEAIPSLQSNSLFDSKLTIEWRFPGGNWQLSTVNVWSLGCAYEAAGQPPYTNIIKGGDTILINTCFYWTTDQYTGERIDFIVTD